MKMETTPPPASPTNFAAMSASRWLVFGGIALIAGGMLFGDIFAVFVLHQNGNHTGALLAAAVRDLKAQDADGIRADFQQIGGSLEDRGTKVDTHVHMTDAGYLALLLALVQPFVCLPQARKKFLAKLFLLGGVLLPLGIFLIHYVGLAYSPFPVIGWASVLADGAGLLLIIALTGEILGLYLYLRGGRDDVPEPNLPRQQTWAERVLLSGGTVLVLVGFAYGAWYAVFDLYRHEARETTILSTMISASVTGQTDPISSVADYGGLAAERAVKIAAHSHVIEFGLLAILLSFLQPYIFLSERWRRRWVILLLKGSLILPVFVRLELNLGLVAGGIADVGGLMVIVALIAMLVGVVRHSGKLDTAVHGAHP
jgi:hypothetical protein